MNLLITGGAGFIGSNLIQHIIDRPEVSKLVNLDCLTYAGHLANLEPVASHPKYVFEKVDLRDKSAVLRAVQQHEITQVMHLAAESHVDRSISGPGDFIQTNIVGTFNLLEACRTQWLGTGPGSASWPVKIVLGNCRVASYQMSGSDDGTLPVEGVTFVYQTIEWTFPGSKTTDHDFSKPFGA